MVRHLSILVLESFFPNGCRVSKMDWFFPLMMVLFWMCTSQSYRLCTFWTAMVFPQVFYQVFLKLFYQVFHQVFYQVFYQVLS